MNLVLIILSLGAIWLALGYFSFTGHLVGSEHWVRSMIEHSSAGTGLQLQPADAHSSIFGFGVDPHFMMYFVSGTVGVLGLAIAYYFHFLRRKQADALRSWMLSRFWIGWIPRAMEHKWYVDEIYLAVIRFPLWLLAHVSYIFDRLIVDGLMVNGTARLAKFSGELLRPLYNGRLQGYASTMAGGIALILAWIVWIWMKGGAS